jgi:hypothetical protein
MPTPALDFLEKVRTWQEADGTSAGLPVMLPDTTETELAGILRAVREPGSLTALEDRARRWLIGYHELVLAQGGLTPDQEHDLDRIVRNIPLWDARQDRAGRHSRNRHTALVITVTTAIGVVVAIVLALILSSGQPGPPPGAPAGQPAPGPVQGPLTDLQQFRADWSVPASATADAGNPAALVLLQDGLYYVTPWTLPSGDPGWTTDTTGAVSAAEPGPGGDVSVTDSDGNTWTVTVRQPFAIASNPQFIFRVLRGGTIQTMPDPHAITVRTRI